jgi:hypothetical protein
MSLNLKTKKYVGDQHYLFDIEKEIESYIDMIKTDIDAGEKSKK